MQIYYLHHRGDVFVMVCFEMVCVSASLCAHRKTQKIIDGFQQNFRVHSKNDEYWKMRNFQQLISSCDQYNRMNGGFGFNSQNDDGHTVLEFINGLSPPDLAICNTVFSISPSWCHLLLDQ